MLGYISKLTLPSIDIPDTSLLVIFFEGENAEILSSSSHLVNLFIRTFWNREGDLGTLFLFTQPNFRTRVKRINHRFCVRSKYFFLVWVFRELNEFFQFSYYTRPCDFFRFLLFWLQIIKTFCRYLMPLYLNEDYQVSNLFACTS